MKKCISNYRLENGHFIPAISCKQIASYFLYEGKAHHL